MTDTVITNGGTDREGKLCKCSECGLVAIPTYAVDFYISDATDETSALLCEHCLDKAVAKMAEELNDLRSQLNIPTVQSAAERAKEIWSMQTD